MPGKLCSYQANVSLNDRALFAESRFESRTAPAHTLSVVIAKTPRLPSDPRALLSSIDISSRR